MTLKGLVHKLAPKISFPSNASVSTYFIIIILFDIEIEHKNTKKHMKKFMPLVGSNPRRSITHLYKHNHLNRVPHAIHFNDFKDSIWTFINMCWRVPAVRILVVTLLTICHTLFRNIKKKIWKSAIYNSWTSPFKWLQFPVTHEM